jgi:serine phosphatase RsbU (regulator of sigma subunit)
MDRAGKVLAANRDRPAAEVVTALCDAVKRYAAPHAPSDDLTVVVARILARKE